MHQLSMAPSDCLDLGRMQSPMLQPPLRVERHLNPLSREVHWDPGQKAKALSQYCHVSEDGDPRAAGFCQHCYPEAKRHSGRTLFWDYFLAFCSFPTEAKPLLNWGGSSLATTFTD